jgi:hypothetical protein
VRWCRSVSPGRVVRAVFTKLQLCCLSPAALFGQLFPSKVEQFNFFFNCPMFFFLSFFFLFIYSHVHTLFGNSVLSAVFWPWDPHLSCIGKLACHHTPTLSLCSLPHPCFPGQVQYSILTSTVSVRLQFAAYVLQFCWVGGSVCPETVLDYFLGGWLGESHVLTCSFCSFMQAALELAGREKWFHCFSVWHGIGRLSMVWGPRCHRVFLIDGLSSTC